MFWHLIKNVSFQIIMVSIMGMGEWQELGLERQGGARAKEPESERRATKGF